MFFVKNFPWGQEVSSYVLVCVVFLLQGGGFVGIRIDLYFCCVAFIVPPIVCWGGGCPLFVWPTFSLGLMTVMGSGFAECCTLWLIVNW